MRKLVLVASVLIVALFLIYIMDDKVYTPEIIQENPFPGELITSVPSSGQANPAGVYTSTIAPVKTFPRKVIAQETVAAALNTKSRKILQEFELQQSGGLKIGDFKEGISGDLRLTPNGMIARDIAGITTFAIDGSDGSAIFRGTIQASDFIVADEEGLVSLNSFENNSVGFSHNQTFFDSTVVDVTGSTMTTSNFTRSKKVLILAQLSVFFGPTAPGAYWGEFEGRVMVDNVHVTTAYVTGNNTSGFQPGRFSPTMSTILTLGTGVHTIKIVGLVNGGTNCSASINVGGLQYIILGT